MSDEREAAPAGSGERAEQAPSPLRNPEFARLMAVSITVALGFGMIIPTLPEFARSFGVSLSAIGLVLFVFGFMRFSFGLVGGLVTDRFGERACTITGLLIVAASSYAAGFSQTFGQLVAARGFGGAGSALFIAGLMNRILRIIEPSAMGRASGQFRSSFLVGIGIGPFVGGVLNDVYGLAAPFHVYGTVLIVAAAIAFVAMRGPATVRSAERKSPLDALRAARPLFSDIRYAMALGATFVGWWALAGPLQTVGPVFAREELGLSRSQVGLAVTMLAVGEILVLIGAGRAADRFGRRAVLIPSLAVTAVATAALGFTVDFPAAYYALMILVGGGIAAGSTAAGGLLADAIPREGSGAAVGVNQMAGDLGFLLSPTTVGFSSERLGFGPGFVIGATPAALLFVASFRLPRGAPSPAPKPVPVEPSEPVA